MPIFGSGQHREQFDRWFRRKFEREPDDMARKLYDIDHLEDAFDAGFALGVCVANATNNDHEQDGA